ncbi:Hypothetical membrane protein [Microbacterium esteraromaticum]|uniref:Hypothetical membrane protein n=1 Tax=Microbacterium esteraromaticum TaxID=57043 RepID=A0A1R4JBQ8_9MICO|nr:DUF6264 family protein [Microbacterium esteraromaticum]SJN29225.1 Hypothetical membrane protein [Microbacterium esteraromaticum]
MSVDRPQYGEYATPEEQRARAGLPPLSAEPVVAEAIASAPPVTRSVTAGPDAAARPSATAPSAAPRIGRLITFALLGVGFVNVLTSIGGFLDLSTTLNTTLKMLGIDGQFTNFGAAKVWGVIAAIVMIVGYAATVWLSFRQVKRNRAAWWIPLVGFIVTMLLVSICTSVPMFGDPAFTQGILTPPAG